MGANKPQKQTRTLRAGEGYLAQSSKWIYFGLVPGSLVDRIEVLWPSGAKQKVVGCQPGHWYRVVEGGAEPEEWSPPSGLESLSPAPLEPPPVSDRARIVLLNPIPLPELEYANEHGEVEVLNPSGGRPRLVNLWASWCQPCVHELAQWSAHQGRFDEAGLEVVALNVDEVAERPGAQEILDRLHLPFRKGWDANGLVTQFDLIQRSLLSRQRALPVPSSFLIDGQGRLRAVYKGPVDVETLIRDAQLMQADKASILASAIPFQGTWRLPPGGSTPMHLALKFAEGGFPDLVVAYIERLIRSPEEHSEYLTVDVWKLYGAIQLDQKHFQQAASAFSNALRLSPDDRQANIELGSLLIGAGKGEQAAPHFERVLAANRNDPELLFKLGVARTQQGQLDAARDVLEESLQLKENAAAHWHLADVLVHQRDVRGAIEHYERAIDLESDRESAANNLAWLLATIDNDALRNGPRALELARQICAEERSATASNLDTLAAALAANGKFDEAITVAQRAIAAARGDNALQKKIQARLGSYRSRRAVRQTL